MTGQYPRRRNTEAHKRDVKAMERRRKELMKGARRLNIIEAKLLRPRISAAGRLVAW